jgi:two-component system chemotaxis response regulator CheB
MPKMDGLQTLEWVMKTNPTPTIMITIMEESENAILFFKALQLGAFDIISKPHGIDQIYLDKLNRNLIEKIKLAAESKQKVISLANQRNSINTFFSGATTPKVLYANKPRIGKNPVMDINTPDFDLLVIGASTGGPKQVYELISHLRYSLNLCIVVIQHMPAGFTELFAQRLSRATEFRFAEALHLETLHPGQGYVAPGDYHLTFILENQKIKCALDQRERVFGLRPCINYTMVSAGTLFRSRCYGVILTGMGSDGTEGMTTIKSFGGITFAQELNEALIDSMPKSSINAGNIDYILSVQNIAITVNQLLAHTKI